MALGVFRQYEWFPEGFLCGNFKFKEQVVARSGNKQFHHRQSLNQQVVIIIIEKPAPLGSCHFNGLFNEILIDFRIIAFRLAVPLITRNELCQFSWQNLIG